jgi:hypothetical protein
MMRRMDGVTTKTATTSGTRLTVNKKIKFSKLSFITTGLVRERAGIKAGLLKASRAMSGMMSGMMSRTELAQGSRMAESSK